MAVQGGDGVAESMRSGPAGGELADVTRPEASTRASIRGARFGSATAVETVAAKASAAIVVREVIRSVRHIRDGRYIEYRTHGNRVGDFFSNLREFGAGSYPANLAKIGGANPRATEQSRRRPFAIVAPWERSDSIEHVSAGGPCLGPENAVQAPSLDLKPRPWALSQSSISVAVKEPTPGSARSSSRV